MKCRARERERKKRREKWGRREVEEKNTDWEGREPLGVKLKSRQIGREGQRDWDWEGWGESETEEA